MMIYKIKAKLTSEEMITLNWLLELADLLEPLECNMKHVKSIKEKIKIKEITSDDKKI